MRDLGLERLQPGKMALRLHSANKELTRLLDSSLVLQSFNRVLKGFEDELSFYVEFCSMKPFKGVADFVITFENGGTCKLKVGFEVDFPVPDGLFLIRIVGYGLTTSQVTLRSR